MKTASFSVHIFLLGRFEVTRGDRILPASLWTRRKAAALLQRLAQERRLLKDQAIDYLWPDADPVSGANNLYRTLHSLRQTLDAHLGAGTSEATLRFDDGILYLHESVWTDVAEFTRLSATQPNEPLQRRVSRLEQAVQLYQGDLLPDDRYAEWTLGPREDLRRRQREMRLALATHARDVGDYPSAITGLRALLKQDPADEPVHRELMRVYAVTGHRHEALRQYQACIDALTAELNVTPEPETDALYTQILHREVTPPVVLNRATPAPASEEAERDPPLVGRQIELESIRTSLDHARSGHGRIILIAGESGVGKTRLASEVLRIAAAAGMITLSGVAYEQEGQLPYQPFIEAFDRYLSEQQRSRDENPITQRRRHGGRDAQQEQWALFNAAASFLTDAASRAPVVLEVDDLHAADEASLQLFHYLARHTRTTAVVLLATYRSDVVTAPTAPLGSLLHALYRERLSETIHLAPLDAQSVGQIMTHTLGGAIAPELVRTIFDMTEGNAFFVEEMTRALLKADHLVQDSGVWHLRAGVEPCVPSDLSELLHARVQRLGTAVEAALAAAAVIGGAFRFDVLRGVAELPDSALLDALDAALASHLLEETADGYRFRHPLIRRTLYDALSRVRRARLHQRTAEAIEAVCAQWPDRLTSSVEDLAFHYERSDRRGRALEYLIQAGRKAARMYAFGITISYYERALALLDDLGAQADAERRFQLLESLGRYYKMLADTPKAVAAFERALAVRDEQWRPLPREQARIHRLAAVSLLTAGRIDEAATHLGQARTALEAGSDARELANVLYYVAQIHWHRNEYRQAFDVAQRSLTIAEQLNDEKVVARAFEMLALACHSLGEWQAGIQYEEQRTALAGPGLDVTDAFDVHL